MGMRRFVVKVRMDETDQVCTSIRPKPRQCDHLQRFCRCNNWNEPDNDRSITLILSARSTGLVNVVGEGPEAKAVLDVEPSAEIFSSQGFALFHRRTELPNGLSFSRVSTATNVQSQDRTNQCFFVALHRDLFSKRYSTSKNLTAYELASPLRPFDLKQLNRLLWVSNYNSHTAHMFTLAAHGYASPSILLHSRYTLFLYPWHISNPAEQKLPEALGGTLAAWA